MPIRIYCEEDVEKEIAWLCDGNWRLPDQIFTLEKWLQENKTSLKAGNYIADVGFSVREDALGGGSVISKEMMRSMAHLGVTLFLSEYPSSEQISQKADLTAC